MGTHSVTHREKNECYTVPVPMLPTGSPVEWGQNCLARTDTSKKLQANKSTKFHIVLFITWCPFSQI